MEELRPIIEWQCPKCTLVIQHKSDRTLAIDQALHLKKHEFCGE